MGERVDVAIVGAGAAGLGFAARLRSRGERSFRILDREEGVGGTWRLNTYPGAASDVPSHLYSFSFAPNPGWTRRYPPQSEMLAYLERLTDEQGLREHLRLGTEVREARFDGGRWRLELAGAEPLEADVLVAACGQLSVPQVPRFAGVEDYRGPSWHSARWDHSVALDGKRVAVVGSGASAIQIVPELATRARTLHVFQRTPPWMIPRKDRRYTRAERRLFAASPAWRRAYRGYIYWRLESLWSAFTPGTPMSRVLTWMARHQLETQVPDPALRARLLPTYPIGCKRVLVSDDYYPALVTPGVELVTDPIDRFVPEGIRTRDGRVRELDAVVFATGFASQSLVAPMRVVGAGGTTLDERWARGPEAHLGLTVSGFPNLFLLYGPNTNLGHNSIIFMLESQIDYVLKMLDAMRRRGARTADVRPEVMERFNADLQSDLRDSVWSMGCSNWYKDEAGRINNNWYGPAIRYWWATRRPDLREYALA